jgi:hypothetical protein
LFADFHALPPADNVSSSPVRVVSAFRNLAQNADRCLLMGNIARGACDLVLTFKCGDARANEGLYSVPGVG